MPDGDSPRIRFAKAELVKILAALERVDADDLDAVMRMLRLEDELADARELATRWRRSYEVAQELLVQTAGLPASVTVERLDEAWREWVGKA